MTQGQTPCGTDSQPGFAQPGTCKCAHSGLAFHAEGNTCKLPLQYKTGRRLNSTA